MRARPEAPRVFDLRVHGDARGELVALQAGDLAWGFAVERVYWVTGVPDGASRGAHAHHATRQLMVVLSGSLDVVFDDGHETTRVTLDRPSRAVTIPPMQWHVMERFAPDTVVMVLASHRYDERDYIRDHATFLSLVRAPTEGLPDEQP